ncbi:hypothetical protein CBS101457_003106 [Exobasidium rhododendri]|nr:hypothetical protein CBS101457_003106 [Exobasidium rhododendri]
MAGISKSKDATGNGDDSRHFSIGDVVLGKIKGYPLWPGILVDDANVPKRKVLDARPGKSYFIVRFFPAADYGFNKAHDLKKLHKREIEAFLSDPHKKGAELREAYLLAKKPDEWNEEQNRIVKEAESKGEDEEDMLEEEEEDEKPTKKRKSTSGQGASKKVKSSSTGGASKHKASSKPASASASRKSEGADEGEGEEAELDPETKKVRGWRHSLQRGFLGKEGSINPNGLDELDKTMKQVEGYEGITADVLRVTKIGKVMRRVVQLPSIPRDEEFKFKERAETLCEKWAAVFSAAKGATSEEANPTNGSSQPKEESKEEGKEEEDAVTNDVNAPAAADESVLTTA